MKKLISFFAAVLLFSVVANAQWPADHTTLRSFDVLNGDSVFYDRGDFYSFVATDGSVVHVWTRMEEAVNDVDPALNLKYVLRMQVFDKDGVQKFADPGICISEQPTMTFGTPFSVVIAPNNDIVAVFHDLRENPTRENMVRRAYIYRYNLNGESVWDKEGVPFPAENDGDSIMHWMGSLCVTESITYVAVGKGPYSSTKQSTSFYQLAMFNNDGSLRSEKIEKIEAAYAMLKPATEGGVIVFYNNRGGGIAARRYDTELNQKWNIEGVERNGINASNYANMARVSQTDDGGYMLTYRKLKGNSGYAVLNRLTPDGRVFAPAKVCTETDPQPADGDNSQVSVNGDKVLVVWNYQHSVGGTKYLAMNIFDTLGNIMIARESTLGYELFPELDSVGKPQAHRGRYIHSVSGGGESIDLWGIIPRQNGWVVIYFQLYEQGGRGLLWAAWVDFEGKIIGRKEIGRTLGDPILKTGRWGAKASITNDDNYAYIFFHKDVETSYNSEGEVTAVRTGGLRALRLDISESDTWQDQLEYDQTVEVVTTPTSAVITFELSSVENIASYRLVVYDQNGNKVAEFKLDANGNVTQLLSASTTKSVTVDGLTRGGVYTYALEGLDAEEKVLDSRIGTFWKDGPTAIFTPEASATYPAVRKCIIDGKVVIITPTGSYTLDGKPAK